MASKCIVLCAVIFVQVAWCAPDIPSSYGSKMSEQFNKNLQLIFGNLHNGITKLAHGPIKATTETIPSIITSGTKKAAQKVSVMADANKEAFGKIATGVGHALGAGGVLASSVAGGAMQVVGQGLGAVNGVVESGAKTGIKIAGKLADKAASGTRLGGDVANAALTAVGDGLTVAEAANGVLYGSMTDLINKIEGQLKLSVSSAENVANKLLDSGSQNIEEGVQSASSSMQRQYYGTLTSLLKIIDSVQRLLVGTANMIDGSAADSTDSAASTSSGSADTTGTTPPNVGTTPPNVGTTQPNVGTAPPNVGTAPPNTGSSTTI